MAHGLILSTFPDRGKTWGEALIDRAQVENWGESALLTILRALPVDRWTWQQAARIGGEIERRYWLRTPVLWMDDNGEDTAHAIRMLIDVGRAREALPLAVSPAKTRLGTALLVELLEKVARQPFEGTLDHNEATMFPYYVAEVLQLLDKRDDLDRSVMIRLEWNYLSVLRHSRRPAKVLLQELAEQPALFIQMLSAAFTSSEESDGDDPPTDDLEKAQAFATHACRLLEQWDRLPGTRDDGTIDGQTLEAWIEEARRLAREVGREEVGDRRIGNLLSASPVGSDGAWPAEPVRKVLDRFHSKAMLRGFQSGKYNRRGVTRRMPNEGGDLERKEAAKYRHWSRFIGSDHPQTARVLDDLAERYEHEARRHDENRDRRDSE